MCKSNATYSKYCTNTTCLWGNNCLSSSSLFSQHSQRRISHTNDNPCLSSLLIAALSKSYSVHLVYLFSEASKWTVFFSSFFFHLKLHHVPIISIAYSVTVVMVTALNIIVNHEPVQQTAKKGRKGYSTWYTLCELIHMLIYTVSLSPPWVISHFPFFMRVICC